MSPTKTMRYVAAGACAVVLAVGAYAIGNSNSNDGTAGSANAAQPASVAPPSVNGATPQNGQGPPQGGQAPPGLGTTATGADAGKAKAAALSRYKGSVERVDKLPDGSYVVHVITSSGEYHVAVSKQFKVTGAQQGGPQGAPGQPPAGAAPPTSTQ